MKEKLKGLLKELTQIPGVSGFEGDIGTYIKKAFSECADEVEVDSLGNVFVTRRGKYEHPSLMIAAHIDQVGGIVKGIEKSGFLRLDRLAGVIPSLLLGRKVLVNGHFGVIGVKPAHLQSPEERSRVADIKELYVDVGALCAEEVSKMGIRVGDPISYISPIEEFTNSDRLCGGAIDDRLGCAVLLALFQKLKDETLPGTLYGVGTVQEEVGSRGAKVAAFKLNPDYAIALDTIPSGCTPDVNPAKEMPLSIGKGPVFLLASGSGIQGSIAHLGVKKILIDTAERIGIPYQLATMMYSFTDAVTIHLTREGIPTGGVGLARRYSHSPVETIDINDAVGALKLLEAFVMDMEKHSPVI